MDERKGWAVKRRDQQEPQRLEGGYEDHEGPSGSPF